MKLEVGMFVRTKEGNIEKICAIENEHIYTDDDYLSWYRSSIAFSKASYNIIDLIEVGDYVNGYMITDFDDDYYDEELDEDVEGFSIVLGNEEQLFRIPPKDIETIVTKEQFEAMQYKVVEEC